MDLEIQAYEYKETSDELKQNVLSGKSKEVGEVFHEQLLNGLKENQQPPQAIFALGSTKVVSAMAPFNTHAERYEASLQIGREFSREFGDEEVQYLIWSGPCVTTDKDSGYLPNEDPQRQTTAVTFILGLQGVHAATSMEEHIEAANSWDYLMWSTRHHEGLPVEEEYVATPVLSTENYQQASPEVQEASVSVDNHNLMNCVVGLSGNIKWIQKESAGKDKDEIDYQFQTAFKEKGIEQDLTIVQRLKFAKRRMTELSEPKKLPKQLKTANLSPMSRNVMETFGINAPELLNAYSIELEDVILQQAQIVVQLQQAYAEAQAVIEELGLFKERWSQYLSSSSEA